MRDGPHAGLAALDCLDASALELYHFLPAARADLVRRIGRPEDAESAYEAAPQLAQNDRERSFLLRRLAEVQQSRSA